MTRTEYEKLKSSGMMWEFHPEFTGVYEEDIPQRSNPMSDQDRVEFEAMWERHADAFDDASVREAACIGFLAARRGMIPADEVLASPRQHHRHPDRRQALPGGATL